MTTIRDVTGRRPSETLELPGETASRPPLGQPEVASIDLPLSADVRALRHVAASIGQGGAYVDWQRIEV
jgi:hypothetical protein